MSNYEFISKEDEELIQDILKEKVGINCEELRNLFSFFTREISPLLEGKIGSEKGKIIGDLHKSEAYKVQLDLTEQVTKILGGRAVEDSLKGDFKVFLFILKVDSILGSSMGDVY